MLPLWVAIGAAGSALVGLNSRATVRLWKSSGFETSQKIAQTFLVWLVPGAFAFVNYFVAEAAGQLRLSKSGGLGDGNVGDFTDLSAADFHSPSSHDDGHG
jgi:hypothetical protein